MNLLLYIHLILKTALSMSIGNNYVTEAMVSRYLRMLVIQKMNVNILMMVDMFPSPKHVLTCFVLRNNYQETLCMSFMIRVEPLL